MYAQIYVFLLYVAVNVFHQSLSDDRILMKEIRTLELKNGVYTTGRRKQPVLQLSCNSGCTLANPSFVVCENRGFIGRRVQWECRGLLPKTVKFGRMIVSCEGYNSNSDPYILLGSCALQYNLESMMDDDSNRISNASKAFILCSIFLLVFFILNARKESYGPGYKKKFKCRIRLRLDNDIDSKLQ